MSATLASGPLTAVPGGRYEDELVIVTAGGQPGLRAMVHGDGRVAVQHRLPRLDDDLAELLAGALTPLTDSHEVYCRAFRGVVLTSDADPLTAWERFYRASLARDGGYAEIHRHAFGLLPHASVLDFGASFGFLSLGLAARGATVVAVERDPATASVLRAMTARLGRTLDILTDTADLPDRCVDAVAMLHVVEHVDEATGHELIAEATRLARHRVVVAVPYEPVPQPLYGHVRRMDDATLAALGERTAWQTTVHDHHGGWLVLDRP